MKPLTSPKAGWPALMTRPTPITLLLATCCTGAWAEEAKELAPVVVQAQPDTGYHAPLATVAGKVPVNRKEIPESVSVLTRQQIETQGLTTVPEALQQLPGVTVIANDNLNFQYLSRGYGLGVMYDGVPSYNGMHPSHQFDLAVYERVELLRGANGLLRGVGEPGGMVNLVRKRPGSEFGFTSTLSYGSYDNKRLDVDLSTPLNADKTLRSRVVLADQNRGYFYDHTRNDKQLGMGTLEYDLSPATTLAFTVTSQNSNVKAPSSGLPTSSITDASGHYQQLNQSRSNYYVPDWGRLSYRMDEYAASIEHRFDNEWLAKLVFNQRDWRQYYKYAYSYSSVNALTNKLSYASTQGDYHYTRSGVDAYAHGPFKLFGRRHELTFGANTETYAYDGRSGRGPTYSTTYGDVSGITEPTIKYTSGTENTTEQRGLYAQTRLNLADPLHLVLGGRLTTFHNRYRSRAPSTSGLDWKSGARADHRFTPFAGLLYDLTPEITLYASQAEIFIPQTQLKRDGSVLDPRTGRQHELGVKGEFMEGRLGASAAWFDIRDRNRAYPDPTDPSGIYYINLGQVQSTGYELEVTGSPLPRVNLSASYTYLVTRYLTDPSNTGLAYSIQSPKNQLRLWGDYRFSDAGPLAGFGAGLGVFAQSPAQSTRGWRDEVVNSGYSVWNGRISYEVNKTYSLALAINNITDRKYYASVGTPNIYNFYGDPRNYMLTLKASY
ncbi:MAG: TonB-dependent siderophore receptor [Zoogloea sp.]|uniref:TonB-dependent siderophore receptor n=1 Tax=Zoogloea sp. TaxID=49181 RepID=UPI003F398814